MSKYGLLIEEYLVMPGDVLDDEEGKTKYTILHITPKSITIEWEFAGVVKKSDVPPSSWRGAIVIDLEESDDPNVAFKLRKRL